MGGTRTCPKTKLDYEYIVLLWPVNETMESRKRADISKIQKMIICPTLELIFLCCRYLKIVQFILLIDQEAEAGD